MKSQSQKHSGLWRIEQFPWKEILESISSESNYSDSTVDDKKSGDSNNEIDYSGRIPYIQWPLNAQAVINSVATSSGRIWTTVRPKQPEGTEYRALHLRSTEKTFKTKRNVASARIKICV